MTPAAPGTATAVVRRALAGTGIELVASCSIERYDQRAPQPSRSAAWLTNARGLVVAASAGPALWRGFRGRMAERPDLWNEPHPYDAFVAEHLARADAALAASGTRFRRFDAAVHAPVVLDFVALADLVGLGAPGPFALAIHPEHGAWWALRGAWMVDADVDPPVAARHPCVSCPAPCVGGQELASGPGGIARATVEVRGRCVVGQASRYEDEQIAYHYDRAATVARLQKRSS